MGAIIRLYSAGETWEVPVLFEDSYLLAVDKPSDLPAAPSGPDRTGPSLLGLLHAGIAEGKFQGVISATVPSGFLIV